MDKQALIKEAKRKVDFARNSYSIRLIYEAHGYIKGLVDSGVVTFHEIADLDSLICRDSLNNGEWLREAEKWNGYIDY